MAYHPDQFKAGQVLSARALNDFFAELERLSKLRVQAPLRLADEAAGPLVALDEGVRWWVKLTSAGTGGKYAWTRQQADDAGAWIDHPGGETGTTTVDPVIETTGKDDVATGATAIHEATRDPVSGSLLFTAGDC